VFLGQLSLMEGVQSRDGQSTSGSGDTLTRGVVCGVHSSRYNPRMVRVSLALGIVWQGVDVWCVWSSHYCPRMARVCLELKNSMPFYGVTGHPSSSPHTSLHQHTPSTPHTSLHQHTPSSPHLLMSHSGCPATSYISLVLIPMCSVFVSRIIELAIMCLHFLYHEFHIP